MRANQWNIVLEPSCDRENIDTQDGVLTYGLDGIVNTIKRQTLTEENASHLNVMPVYVAGLNLILPRERVHCVMDWDEPERVENDNSILMGVHNFNGKKLLIFDTAIMVIPQDHPKRSRYLTRRRYKKLIVFDSGKWGLVCERADDDIILKRADMVWRKSFKKHGWLAGILPEQGYSLIDVDRFYAKARRYPL